MNTDLMLQTLRECLCATMAHSTVITDRENQYYGDVVEGLEVTTDKLKLVIKALMEKRNGC